MDSKIEWTEAEGWPLYNGTFVGPQPIVDGVFMRLGENGDNFSLNVAQLSADDDAVVALGTYTWKRKDSGEPAEVKMAHVWTLEDGKLIRFQQHIDTAKKRYLLDYSCLINSKFKRSETRTGVRDSRQWLEQFRCLGSLTPAMMP